MAVSGAIFVQIVIGAQIMTSTLVIGALDSSTPAKDPNENMSITSEEASWYGKYFKNIYYKQINTVLFSFTTLYCHLVVVKNNVSFI